MGREKRYPLPPAWSAHRKLNSYLSAGCPGGQLAPTACVIVISLVLLRCPVRSSARTPSSPTDRCHSLRSLAPPLAALPSLPARYRYCSKKPWNTNNFSLPGTIRMRNDYIQSIVRIVRGHCPLNWNLRQANVFLVNGLTRRPECDTRKPRTQPKEGKLCTHCSLTCLKKRRLLSP